MDFDGTKILLIYWIDLFAYLELDKLLFIFWIKNFNLSVPVLRKVFMSFLVEVYFSACMSQ